MFVECVQCAMHLANVFNSFKIYFYLLILISDCAWVSVAAWAFSSRRERGLLSGCGVQSFCCGGFSCCSTDYRARGFQ